MSERPAWQVGDRVTLSKPHACGGSLWRLHRVGSDVGLKCEQCGRRILLERAQFERRARAA